MSELKNVRLPKILLFSLGKSPIGCFTCLWVEASCSGATTFSMTTIRRTTFFFQVFVYNSAKCLILLQAIMIGGILLMCVIVMSVILINVILMCVIVMSVILVSVISTSVIMISVFLISVILMTVK